MLFKHSFSQNLLLCGAVTALGAAGCAHSPMAGVPVPSTERLIAVPQSAEHVEPVGLKHLLRGLWYLHSGEAAAAIPHLRLALIYAPTSGFVHERLSRAWGLSGNPTKAREVLNSGLAKSPDDPWLRWLAGELAAGDRALQSAVEHLRRAIGDQQVLPLAAPTLVDTLLWLGKGDEAAETVAQALEAKTDDALALRLGNVFEDHGNLDVAVDIYRRARVLNPTSRAAALAEAHVLSMQRLPGDAADALVSMLAFYPDDIDLYIRITRYLLRAGREEAEAFRAEALVQTQGSAHARMALAAADILEGHRTSGLALLRKTISETGVLEARLYLAEILLRLGDGRGCLQTLTLSGQERDPRLHRPRAWCHAIQLQLELAMEQITWAALESDQPREAVVDAARFLSQNAEEEVAREYLSALLRRVRNKVTVEDMAIARSQLADFFGHKTEAIAELEQLGSESPELQLRLADLWARYGRVDEAVGLLGRLQQQEPQDPMRLNALGFVLTDAGRRLGDAEVYLRRAHRLAPDDGYITDSLGWLLLRRGQHEAALDLLRQASYAILGDPEILRHLGDAYRAMGDSDAACAAYRAAMEAKPSPSLRRVLNIELSKGDAT